MLQAKPSEAPEPEKREKNKPEKKPNAIIRWMLDLGELGQRFDEVMITAPARKFSQEDLAELARLLGWPPARLTEQNSKAVEADYPTALYVQLRDEKHTIGEIAAKLRVSGRTVGRHLKAADHLIGRVKPIRGIRRSAIYRQLYEEGNTTAEIAAKFNISPGAVTKAVKGLGVVRPPDKRTRLLRAKLGLEGTTPTATPPLRKPAKRIVAPKVKRATVAKVAEVAEVAEVAPLVAEVVTPEIVLAPEPTPIVPAWLKEEAKPPRLTVIRARAEAEEEDEAPEPETEAEIQAKKEKLQAEREQRRSEIERRMQEKHERELRFEAERQERQTRKASADARRLKIEEQAGKLASASAIGLPTPRFSIAFGARKETEEDEN